MRTQSVPDTHAGSASRDRVLDSFLSRQFEEGMALAAASDLVDLIPFEGTPPFRYVVEFRCKGLVRDTAGTVHEAERFTVGVTFPPHYLRHAEPAEVLTWLGPQNVFHANISNLFKAICIGPIMPGTPLVELMYRCFDVVSGRRVTMDETNALDPVACQWSRDNMHRFPTDPRPIKRRTVKLKITPLPALES